MVAGSSFVREAAGDNIFLAWRVRSGVFNAGGRVRRVCV